MPRPRVLLISSNSSGRGGGERYLVAMAQGLASLGCEVHALISEAAYMTEWAASLVAEGASVHRRQLRALRERPLRFVQAILDRRQQEKVAAFCRELKPDGVLVNQQYDEDGLDFVLGVQRSGNRGLVGVIHMPMTADKHQRSLGRIRGTVLRWWYARHSYPIVLTSSGSHAEFTSYYGRACPTRILHSGYTFPAAPETPRVTPAIPAIGFVGQFVPQKNLATLVAAWACLRRRGIPSRLVLIGDGPLRADLETRLQAVAPPTEWEITGWGPDYVRHLDALDLFTMVSHFESLPLALIEAAAKGIPSVVTDFNGAVDIASHASWVQVVQDTTPDGIAGALARSLGNLEVLKAKGRQGRKEVQRYFSTARMARDLLTAMGLEVNSLAVSSPNDLCAQQSF